MFLFDRLIFVLFYDDLIDILYCEFGLRDEQFVSHLFFDIFFLFFILVDLYWVNFEYSGNWLFALWLSSDFWIADSIEIDILLSFNIFFIPTGGISIQIIPTPAVNLQQFVTVFIFIRCTVIYA